MRIIGGKYKGLKLLPLDSTKIRPTSDRLKESLFSINVKIPLSIKFIKLSKLLA